MLKPASSYLLCFIFFYNVIYINDSFGQNIDTTSAWTIHFQTTVVSQAHPSFHAMYSGKNSLSDTEEVGATSITATLFLGRKLWKGATFYFNPEISGGSGLSASLGVAGALNGESYRVGTASPQVFVARAYFQQNIALPNTTYTTVKNDANQVYDKIPTSSITITVGKFAITDFYDNNQSCHDARTQFLNWSLMGNGAWDYSANTRGYTMGAMIELRKPLWAIRFASVAVPSVANASTMEYNFKGAHAESFEIEKTSFIHKRMNIIHLIVASNYSRAPSYQTGLQAIANGDTQLLNVMSGNAENTNFGGKKFAVGGSIWQELSNDVDAFVRAGWNDGKYATWAFTEIDQTFTAGVSIKGTKWKRSEDVIGLAGAINGISSDHSAFLKAGGYGFIIGDANLNYGLENILECYYSAKLANILWLTLDYQFVNNPAYNKDRGPVHVFGVRCHVEF